MIDEADLRLPPDIRPTGEAEPAPDDPVLVTGATGFLGASIAAELLSSGEQEVWCLVRPRESRTPDERLVEALRTYTGFRPEWAERLRALPGDLEQPGLGLGDADRDRVTREVAQIYHSGAVVSATYSYEAARPANIGGTVELLRLAGRERPKRLNHVSTTSVLWSRSNARRHVDEDSRLTDPDGLPGGYVETKWAAEHLTRSARDRGLDVRCFRTGALGGDSRSGVSNPVDVRWLMVRTCATLGLAPMFQGGSFWQLSWVPVDRVATALVRLSRLTDKQTEGMPVFHLKERNSVRWPEAFSWMRRYGHRLRVTDIEQWRRRVSEAARKAQVPDSMAYFSLHSGTAASPHFPSVIGSARTDELLRAQGIVWPELDADLFFRYLDAGARAGELPDVRGVTRTPHH